MKTRFSPFSSYMALLRSRQTELSRPSFTSVKGLQMSRTQPLTNQPYGPYSKLNSSYVVQSLARPTYIRPNAASAFTRYEQTISRFTYSSPQNMPVHGATPSLVKILSQYKKLPDDEQNADTLTRLNFLLALSRNWFLIKNKLPLLVNQTHLRNEVDSLLKEVTTCFKGKEVGFAARANQELAPIFKRLDEILNLMNSYNIRFSEENLNRFLRDNNLFPPPVASAPSPLVQPAAKEDTSAAIKKYPQLDQIIQKHLKNFNGSLKKDLNRLPYEVTVDNRNVFSTTSIFEPTLAAIRAVKLKFLKESDTDSSSDEEISARAKSEELDDETYIATTKKQVLDKIKAACSAEQFSLVKELACQNIITLLLNYQSILKEEHFLNETPIPNLWVLELGNIVRSNFDIHCDTSAKEVTVKVSFNNHLISQDKEAADKVTELLKMMDNLSHEEKDLASHEFQLDLKLLIKVNGDFTCQDIRITQGKKVIDITD